MRCRDLRGGLGRRVLRVRRRGGRGVRRGRRRVGRRVRCEQQQLGAGEPDVERGEG